MGDWGLIFLALKWMLLVSLHVEISKPLPFFHFIVGQAITI